MCMVPLYRHDPGSIYDLSWRGKGEKRTEIEDVGREEEMKLESEREERKGESGEERKNEGMDLKTFFSYSNEEL